MTMLASQITSLPVVCSIVYSDVNQRKHQSSASLAFVREIHRGPVNFPHKWPVTRKMFPFDDVIMRSWIWVGCDKLCWINGLRLLQERLRRLVAMPRCRAAIMRVQGRGAISSGKSHAQSRYNLSQFAWWNQALALALLFSMSLILKQIHKFDENNNTLNHQILHHGKCAIFSHWRSGYYIQTVGEN